jgi:hypothetical protein
MPHLNLSIALCFKICRANLIQEWLSKCLKTYLIRNWVRLCTTNFIKASFGTTNNIITWLSLGKVSWFEYVLLWLQWGWVTLGARKGGNSIFWEGIRAVLSGYTTIRMIRQILINHVKFFSIDTICLTKWVTWQDSHNLFNK